MEREELFLALARLLGEEVPVPVDFAKVKAARWRHLPLGGRLEGIEHPDLPDPDFLLGIDDVKGVLDQNTRQFVLGLPANDVLLWGGRGTGKSSLVKAMLHRYAAQGLRLVEVENQGILDLPEILTALRKVDDRGRYRYVLFCDDLSFSADDPAYRALKSLLDGGIEARPANVLLYATSNRRHLLPRHFADNEETERRGGEIIPGESNEEKISLSERFGLWLGLYPFDQEQYLSIVAQHIRLLGGKGKGSAWQEEALRWALQRGSRSGRVAQHFARHWVGSQKIAAG
ncbi:MAG: ATP-binding protein [Acidithiobacillus sp.]|nr:ATP-binding protein [Acidithiobacillus sp.]